MTEEKNKVISPCCKVKALLSARAGDREAWRCTKCNKLNVYQFITKTK